MVLCLRRAMALIDRDLVKLVEGLLALARRDGDAPMLARTLMQPAQVVSLGLKLVAWIAPLARIHERLRAKAEAALQLQFGGAVGTLAVMGEHGARVAERMAHALQLRLPVGAWHAQRDELMTLACELGVLAGALGKIARDISLLAQGEVGELSEPAGPGRGGSSAMPHKRNPVAAMVALAGALRAPLRVAALLEAMVQEHERGLGNWQAELGQLAGLCQSTHGALMALAEVADGLVVHRERMHQNIERTQGLVFAEAVAAEIARVIGKPRAQALMERLSQQAATGGASLRELTHAALDSDADLRPHIAHERIETLFDPARAADRSREVAQPQLTALAARARALSATAPWAAWLNA
jgi:3-carboxy-cis,cis-muconate cycloisomerase